MAWAVISGGKKTDIFATFVREDLRSNPKLLEVTSREFFASQQAVKFTEALKYEIREFLGVSGDKSKKRNEKAVDGLSAEEIEGKKLAAVKALIKWASEQAINIDRLEGEEAVLVLKVADKVGMFEDMEKAEVKPQRYLPEQCESCRMRIFVHNAMVNGDIFDDCAYCKYRKYSESNGVRYTDESMLDIPKEIIKDRQIENYVIEDGKPTNEET